jgi:hypothetical protein
VTSSYQQAPQFLATVLHRVNKFAVDNVQRLQLSTSRKSELAEGRDKELDVLTLTGGRCNRLASVKGVSLRPPYIFTTCCQPEVQKVCSFGPCQNREARETFSLRLVRVRIGTVCINFTELFRFYFVEICRLYLLLSCTRLELYTCISLLSWSCTKPLHVTCCD